MAIVEAGPDLEKDGSVRLDPELREPYVRDARAYVRLAEQAHGPIPRAVEPGYVWGDALETLSEATPDARIVNLETSITDAGEFWPGD